MSFTLANGMFESLTQLHSLTNVALIMYSNVCKCNHNYTGSLCSCVCVYCSGTHHKSENCQPTDIVGQINALLTNEHKFLFPEMLVFEGADPTGSQVPKPNGGWGDTRDHELCMSFLA